MTRQPDRFRILSIDGGGIRGLIAARVIARLEELISAEAEEERRLADCFQMFAGTSTGGLLALGLTVPDPADPTRPRLSGSDLVDLYLNEGPGSSATRCTSCSASGAGSPRSTRRRASNGRCASGSGMPG